ncbi:UNVERIFIED_CONTAM: hypothetical protein PYX00_007720 [Menopon gallinae]|uniref:Sperm-associated antigen 6 n=1 Tax=Menopon gallinae TaxID=328185 RepID=A0AAW2HL10_9NEOP
MTARLTLQVLDQYQKARCKFAQDVSELASRSSNVECLVTAGVLDLLRPLLCDPVVSVQQAAAVALGKMANQDEKIAEAIVRKDMLSTLLVGLEKQNKYCKKARLYVLRSIARQSPELADVVIHSGALDAIILCLEDFDQGVKESAVWAVGYVARHSTTQAQAVVDAGAVPLLVLCLQEPELTLRQIAASTFSDIAKHSLRLATTVVDAGAIPCLAKSIANTDIRLKRQSLNALANISKHSVDLAELVVESEIFPEVLMFLSHPDDEVKKSAATLVKEVIKHSLELAQLVVNTGAVAALIEHIAITRCSVRLPGIMSLGYICAHNDQLALAVISARGVTILRDALMQETENHILSATVWAIGQCGKHSPEHAGCIAACDLFPKMLELYTSDDSTEDLKQKCKCALKQVLQKTLQVSALEPLLEGVPSNIIKYVLGQYSKILPNDARARRAFVASGTLRKVQEIDAEPGSTLMEYITIINCCFPDEVVRYYSPGYPDSLLERVEQYHPQIPPLLGGSRQSSEDTMKNLMNEDDEPKSCVAAV